MSTKTNNPPPTEETPKVRDYLLKDWKALDGQEFGGQSDIMELKDGECAGPFTYAGHQQITTELGETTVHLASTRDGKQLRMPIQATFLRAVDQASLQYGDAFAVMRHQDQVKKRGKGAGKPMAIYSLKVISRAAQPE